MPGFLAMLLRCALVLALGFTPVANALEMAAMSPARETPPPCHAPATDQPSQDGKIQTAAHCHCAMSIALPTAGMPTQRPDPVADHPLTVHHLILGGIFLPDTPPPRA